MEKPCDIFGICRTITVFFGNRLELFYSRPYKKAGATLLPLPPIENHHCLGNPILKLLVPVGVLKMSFSSAPTPGSNFISNESSIVPSDL